jgi:hypothetical protein
MATGLGSRPTFSCSHPKWSTKWSATPLSGALFSRQMVPKPLLDRFVPHHEAESSCHIRVRGPLQIEVAERNGMLDRFRPAVFDRDEMQLIIHASVIPDDVRRAIVEHQLRMIGCRVTDV